MLLGIYVDMLQFTEIQKQVVMWVMSVGFSVVIVSVYALIVYCLYRLYRVIRNFSNRY